MSIRFASAAVDIWGMHIICSAFVSVRICVIPTHKLTLYSLFLRNSRSATYSGRSTAEGSHSDRIADIAAAITNNERSKIPFSSRIRRIYLESALKHEVCVFCGSFLSATAT
jgi:hypothetical protein